jgi:hypothetical protein
LWASNVSCSLKQSGSDPDLAHMFINIRHVHHIVVSDRIVYPVETMRFESFVVECARLLVKVYLEKTI